MSPPPAGGAEPSPPLHFIRHLIEEDRKAGRHGGRVHTRFPPEPNGYLHIGHAKSICLNFGLAQEYRGRCNLRFDDTNPTREDVEYVEAIQEDVRWLGFDWEDRLFYASDYFEQLYQYAVELIRRGAAYVCSLSPEEVRAYRGGWDRPGRDSPYRNRSVEENLDLFRRMRAGEFEDGQHTLRARIDMASSNMNLRDPPLYRIRKVPHHRTGDRWCIYPTYDFAHGLSDSLEGITHSICTLEFEDHRPLYDWILDQLEVYHPQQIEFARLNMSHTVMSKRKLLRLVNEGHVSGWDDPRMPTLVGMRRRGYTPAAIRAFCERIGVSKYNSVIDLSILEECVRDDLNAWAPRRLAVLEPLRLVIDNYPEGRVEELTAPNHPQDPSRGTRRLPFSRVLYVERDDFREEPPPKYHRLAPGREVRLRFAYFVKCERVVQDARGAVTEIHCTYDPDTLGGEAPDGRKVKGTIHWVSAEHAVAAEVRLYEPLLLDEARTAGEEEDDFVASLNPRSLQRLTGCRLEPSLGSVAPGELFQFERQGYFCADPDTAAGAPVFGRTVTLRDSWARIEKTAG